jgi:Ca2+-binding EF-hand superfamily protein
LREKLQSRINSRQTEEQTLVRMFKHFDQGNKGTVNTSEFARVLEKTGMYYPDEIVSELFKLYDTDQSGSLDYRELAQILSATREVKPKPEPIPDEV